jgi:NADH-quinone oxidoreductase subunit J
MPELFYVLAVITVLGALALVLVPNPVYCALSLVGSFFAMAAIFILLNQEFLAAIQILVYAGAIMVLFLFVIMLLNLRSDAPFKVRWTFRHVLSVAIVLGILSQLAAVFSDSRARLGPLGDYSPERVAKTGAVQIVSDLLFTTYVLPFEVISVLLMVAVMGAVLLAKRRRSEDGPGDAGGESAAGTRRRP